MTLTLEREIAQIAEQYQGKVVVIKVDRVRNYDTHRRESGILPFVMVGMIKPYAHGIPFNKGFRINDSNSTCDFWNGEDEDPRVPRYTNIQKISDHDLNIIYERKE